MRPDGAGSAPKNSVTISTLPFNVMLLFVATFDMAHETVRSEVLGDKLRPATRRLSPLASWTLEKRTENAARPWSCPRGGANSIRVITREV